MIVSFLCLVLGFYKRVYLLILNVCHFDYKAFAASERTGSRKPVNPHKFIGCHYKCTQTDRPKPRGQFSMDFSFNYDPH